MIVEMAGRPPEHLSSTIERHMDILNRVEDIKVHSIKISKPREVASQDGKKTSEEQKLFTAFAEADFETESFSRLTQIMFDFMPSSIEVIEPAKIDFNSKDATDLLNNISGRLHRYDEIAKIAGSRLNSLNSQLQLAQNIINQKNQEIINLSSKKSSTVKSTLSYKTEIEYFCFCNYFFSVFHDYSF